jgi:uncharacterized coiled-coil protein SlyX
MDEALAHRLEQIETALAHLEKQYDQLNEALIDQARTLARIQLLQKGISETVSTIELERIRTTQSKPPHYQ